LTDNPGFDDSPAWSPDGTRIAFFSGIDGVNGLYIMNSDGTALHQVSNTDPTDTDPSWSPDGSRLAFQSSRGGGGWEIYTMGVDGSDLRRLTSTANAVSDFHPAWSPDGSRIVFSSDRTGALVLHTMAIDGSNVTALGGAGSPAQNPSWSR